MAKEIYLPKDAKMPKKAGNKTIAKLIAEQPPEFTKAYREFINNPGALNALAMPSAPFEVMGNYAGDTTLDATGSPALATAAYLTGSGMLGTAPLELGAKGLPALGKAGLEAIHKGIAFGEGPLSGLSHLAPSVIKREGGNWFPGEIEKQVKNLQSKTTNPDVSNWLAGPMKNYIQKRFASPNDEIRKLYDQGITISPPPEQQNFTQNKIWQKNRQFADPTVKAEPTADTFAGLDWEQRADNMLSPDTALLNRANNNISMPRYLHDYSPTERIGAETARYLRRTSGVETSPINLLPPELQAEVRGRLRGIPQNAAGALAKFAIANPTLISEMPRNIDSLTGKLASALQDSYAHLASNPMAKYTGRMIKHGNNERYDPFKRTLTLDELRTRTAPKASWLANVPLDNPVNTFGISWDGRSTNPTSLERMPEFQHMIDVMHENIGAGNLTPRQLETGAYSVEAAARDAHTYNIAKEAAAAKNKQIAAQGFPTLKQYDSGHKWIDLKHTTDNDATAKALKDEGNAMGHCVGSYCPEVLKGSSRIVSLRDPSGKSRATIELRRSAVPFGRSLRPELQQQVREQTKMPEWSIQQIKGLANRKPGQADIPMIQDYIMNNGPWHGDIGDFHNTDLMNLDEAIAHNSRYLHGQPENVAPLQSFVDWAKQAKIDQGHPYIDKDELLSKYKELSGDTDGPVY